MICDEVMEFMQRELDRDLSGSEQERLFSHLKQCPECSAMFKRLKSVSLELEQLPKVFPPINIVDSILPKLSELELGFSVSPAVGADTRAANPVSNEKDIPVLERRTAWFSWKLAGGAVAAAVVLGLFLFNGQSKNNNTAEEIAKDAAVSGSSAQGTMPQNSSGKGSGSAANAGAPNDPVSHEVIPAPPAQQETSPKIDSMMSNLTNGPASTPAQTQTPNAAAQPTPAAELKQKASTPQPSPVPKSSVLEDRAAASTPPVTTFTAPVEGDNAAEGTAADQAGSDAGIKSIAPDSGAAANANRSLTLFSAAAPQNDSPDHSKTAVLLDGHVVIRATSNGETRFTSSNKWLPSDNVSFAWRTDTMLAYTVTRQDKTSIVYVIDLEKKTEQTELQKKETSN